MWQTVQQDLEPTFRQAGLRIEEYSLKCLNDWKPNSEVNIPKMVEAVSSKPVDTRTAVTLEIGMMERWYPERFWLGMVTGTIEELEDFYYICYDCIGMIAVDQDLPTNPGKNDVIASWPLNTEGNHTITTSQIAYDYSNNGELNA